MDKHTIYEHNTSIQELQQQSLEDVLYDDMKENLRNKPKYCLVFGEFTYISVKKNLVTCISFLETDAFGVEFSITDFLLSHV